MQNKKVKHRAITKYLHFHKITGPTLFYSGEKKLKNNKKKKKKKKEKKKFLLPTDKFFFSTFVETQLYFYV